MSVVTAEREGKRIIVNWSNGERFKEDLAAIKAIPGRRWLKDKPGRPWSVPLDMTVCRLLRKGYGDRLEIGDALRSWAYGAVAQENQLGSTAAAESAELVRLPEALPKLYEALYYGPLGKRPGVTEGSYQTADVRFLSDSSAPGNFNHQGLGKTLEAIGEVWESGREDGCHLVICPKTAVEAVWEEELLRWHEGTTKDVFVYPCAGSTRKRREMLAAFMEDEADVKWVIVNPEMVRYRKELWRLPTFFGTWLNFPGSESQVAFRARPKEWPKACHCARLVEPHWHYRTEYPELGNTAWRTIINDEVHRGNIRNQRSLTARSIYDLKCEKPIAQSGTPMKQKGADIWGTLHWLRPDVFTSFWNFAEMFFKVEQDEHGYKHVGKLRPEMEEEFFRYLTPYVLRRTKAECAPWLPPKQHVDVWLNLEGKQAEQYEQMEAEGIAKISGRSVSTSSILAQFTRLQQFANAYCDIDDRDRVVPTPLSVKLEALWERLSEAGILDGSSTDKVVIFSMSERLIALVAKMIAEENPSVAVISGKTVRTRKVVRRRFQEGDLQILCVVTTAGGTALTLDAADVAHFLDESWAPDDQEQAEDRLHRVSRIHQVTIYHYLIRNSIDEDKREAAMEKASAHSHILDIRRQILARRS